MAKLGTIEVAVDVKGGLKRWDMNRRAGDAKNAEIRIYSDIGFWYGAQMFLEQLDALGHVEVLDVRINSFGGVASEGIAIYQALARHPATKRVWIDAAAYSAATIVAMAASPGELRMAFNARAMIHNAWNYAEGDHREMQKVAEILKLLDGTIAATYARRMSKFSKDELLKMMADETWYDAEGAVAAGFADETFDAGAVDLPEDELNIVREFKRTPQEIIEKLRARAAAKGEAAGETNQAAAVDVMARWAAVRAREAA